MYINGVEISGISTKPIELTQAEYDLLPEEKKQNGCYIITDAESTPMDADNIAYDNTSSGLVATDVQAAIDELAEGGGGGGGHIIVNDAGTSMTQRSDLQFNGVYTSDNSTDDTTEVNIVREMTEAQYSQLTDAEKKGIIVTDASTPSVIGLTGDMVMYDSTNTVNDKLDDISTTKAETIQFTNSKCSTTYSIVCQRNGNVVNISTIILASSAISANEILATIPEDYRPSNNYSYFTAPQNVVVQARTNGEFKVADISAQIPASVYFGINLTFIV